MTIKTIIWKVITNEKELGRIMTNKQIGYIGNEEVIDIEQYPFGTYVSIHIDPKYYIDEYKSHMIIDRSNEYTQNQGRLILEDYVNRFIKTFTQENK